MKKITAIAIVLSALAPALAHASGTVSLTASSQSVTVGKQVTVSIFAIPASDTLYTAKVAVSYSNGLLSSPSFTLAPTWLALSQPGYDSMDQSTGSVIKTAGYPSGFTASQLFGTLTFTGTTPGTATISVTSDTQLLNAQNTNVYAQGNASSVVLAISPAPVVPKTTTKVNPSAVTVSEPTNAPTTSSATALATATAPLTAAAASSGSASYLWYILLAVVIIGIGVWYWRKNRANKA